jgi:hypothetical protein
LVALVKWALLWGTRVKVFIVAIGSSSFGDTLEGDLEKKVGFGMKKAATGTALTTNLNDL